MKLFVIVHPRDACKMLFPDQLWLIFIDQLQPDKAVFAIISFDILRYLVIEWRHGIYFNNIVTHNLSDENLSTLIVEITNIDESLHERGVSILNTKTKIV